MLLKFVTSCSRAPLLGFKYLQPTFTIHKVCSWTYMFDVLFALLLQLKLRNAASRTLLIRYPKAFVGLDRPLCTWHENFSYMAGHLSSFHLMLGALVTVNWKSCLPQSPCHSWVIWICVMHSLSLHFALVHYFSIWLVYILICIWQLFFEWSNYLTLSEEND